MRRSLYLQGLKRELLVDLRSWASGMILLLLFLNATDEMRGIIDRLRPPLPHPIISATVEPYLDAEGDLHLRYGVTATRQSRATWVATLFVVGAEGRAIRVATRSGCGPNYSPARNDVISDWGWAAFFEGAGPCDLDTEDRILHPPPRLPVRPFFICLQYLATDSIGRKSTSPRFCSEPFDPRDNQGEMP